jgi:hypothetical protein
MGKNLLNKLVSYNDAGAACANAGAVYAVAYAIDIGVNAFLHFNLNEYNSIVHLTAGTGIGTYAYRRVKSEVIKETGDKIEGTKKGIIVGLVVGAAVSFAWEYAENKGHIFQPMANPLLDTMLDNFAVIGGSAGIAPLLEMIKPYFKRKLPE